jgi:hypothetical protein
MALLDPDLVDENRFYVDWKMERGDRVALMMVTTRVDVAQCTDGLNHRTINIRFDTDLKISNFHSFRGRIVIRA